MAAKNPFDLSGQVAVITGSSRGIGRSIAEHMAALGAKVVISSRKAEPCEEVAAAIRTAGGEAIVIPCNISRKTEVEALIKGTLDKWDRIDSLVCNAAVNPYYGPVAGLSDEAFDKIMGSNVKSNIWLTNLAVPGMIAQGGGTIIIVSSIAGLKGNAIIGAYGISKAADFALARNLAVEHGQHNIRANCIAPGLIKTDFAKALWEDEKAVKARNAVTPLRRIGEPHEIGGIAAFLAKRPAIFTSQP